MIWRRLSFENGSICEFLRLLVFANAQGRIKNLNQESRKLSNYFFYFSDFSYIKICTFSSSSPCSILKRSKLLPSLSFHAESSWSFSSCTSYFLFLIDWFNGSLTVFICDFGIFSKIFARIYFREWCQLTFSTEVYFDEKGKNREISEN